MNCPNCYNPASSPSYRMYHTCDHCGVHFIPDVSEQQIAEYYRSGNFRKTHRQNDELAHQRRRAENIIKYIQKPKVFLDIGCSAGVLMETVRARFGCQCYGVDPDPILARSVYKTISDVNIQADCVTLVHSLEHMPHPLDALKDVYHKMTPGGQIVIEVPNGSLEDGPCYLSAFNFPHVVMFSEKALRWTMEQAGFCVENTVIHGEGGLLKAPRFYYLLVTGRRL